MVAQPCTNTIKFTKFNLIQQCGLAIGANSIDIPLPLLTKYPHMVKIYCSECLEKRNGN